MKYICKQCGEVIDEDELGAHEESRGEFWGTEAYERVGNDCSCGGDYVEAGQCKQCGEYFEADKLTSGWCPDCIAQKSTVENAMEIGQIAKRKVEINSLLAFFFQAGEIEEILTIELIKARKLDAVDIDRSVKEYCEDYAEELVKVV